ncbi:LysR family transcriptional regulator [Sphingobium chlorophenolicum]|nr:LysR family transcriptional regulator [Sphingobium chlorophenolicum]
MNNVPDRLSGLSAFVRTADLGSFVAAGKALGLSPSAVGKAVTKLEDQLGVRLIQRSTRKLSLTEEGRMFHERCRRVLEELDDAQESLQRMREMPRGLIRLSSPVIGQHVLMPALPAFLARYPEIEFDLDFSDRGVDLIDDGADVALLMGPIPDNRFMVRRLKPYRHLLCASPSYLQQFGEPKAVSDLMAHRGIGFRFPDSGRLYEHTLRRSRSELPVRHNHFMTCNSLEAVREAVIRGIGIGCLPEFLAKDQLSSGTLVPLLTDIIDVTDQFSLVWPSSRHLSPKIRVFVDFMARHLFASE